MTKYRKKPVIIEAITFDELVEYGRQNGGNIVNGMPGSFQYNGHPITNENDECYLIPTLEGTMRFTPSDMLITGVQGEIYPCKRDIFEATYERVDEMPTRDQRVLELLKEVEFSGWDDIWGGFTACPACNGNREREGHKNDCKLKQMIDELEASTR